MGRHLSRRIRRHAREGRPLGRVLPAVGELGHEGDNAVALPALDGAPVHLADPRDRDARLLEQLSGLQGRVEDLAHLEERPRLLQAAASLRVEPGVADGRGGLGHEAVEEVPLVRPEGEGLAPVERQHAEQHSFVQDRNREEAPEPMGLPPLAPDEAMIGEDVRGLERLPVRGDPAHGALVEAHPEHGEVGGKARVGERPELDRPRGLIGHPQQDGRRAHQLGGGAGDGAQHLVRVQRRRDDLPQPRENQETRRPHFGGLEEARIVQRDGGLRGEGAQHLGLRRRGHMRLPPVHGQRPMRAALDHDGDGERGPVPLPGDESAIGLVQGDGGVGEQIGGPDRNTLGEGPPRRALAGADPEPADELRGQARAAIVDETALRLVHPEDAGRAHAHERPAALGDHVQHLLHVERRADEPAHLEEGAVLCRPLLRLGEEPRVLDRRGGVAGKDTEHVHLGGPELARQAAEDRQHPQQPLPRDKGHAGLRHETLREQPGDVDEPRVPRDVLGDGRLPRPCHQARQPLAQVERRRKPKGFRVPHAGLGAHDEAALLDQPEPRRRARHDLHHGAGRRLGHLAERQRRGQLQAETGEGLQPLVPGRGLLEEGRPLQRHADLPRHGLEDLHLPAGHLPRLPGHQRKHPPDLVLHGDWHRHLHPVAPVPRQLPQPRLSRWGRLQRGHIHGARQHGPAQEAAHHWTLAQHVRLLRSEPPLGDQHQGLGAAVQPVDGAGRDPREGADDAERLVGRRRQVGAARDGGGDGGEGFELSVPPQQVAGRNRGPALARLARRPGAAGRSPAPEPERHGRGRQETDTPREGSEEVRRLQEHRGRQGALGQNALSGKEYRGDVARQPRQGHCAHSRLGDPGLHGFFEAGVSGPAAPGCASGARAAPPSGSCRCWCAAARRGARRSAGSCTRR